MRAIRKRVKLGSYRGRSAYAKHAGNRQAAFNRVNEAIRGSEKWGRNKMPILADAIIRISIEQKIPLAEIEDHCLRRLGDNTIIDVVNQRMAHLGKMTRHKTKKK